MLGGWLRRILSGLLLILVGGCGAAPARKAASCEASKRSLPTIFRPLPKGYRYTRLAPEAAEAVRMDLEGDYDAIDARTVLRRGQPYAVVALL